jgi:hypothetical protein
MAPGCDFCADIRVTARNELASSNDEQMGQFPKKFAATKASKPRKPLKPPRTGLAYPSPASR